MDMEPNGNPHAHETAFTDAARAASAAAAPPAASAAPPAQAPAPGAGAAPQSTSPPGPSISTIGSAASGTPAAPPSPAATRAWMKELAAAEGYDVAQFESEEAIGKAAFARLKKLTEENQRLMAQIATPPAAHPAQPAPQPQAPVAAAQGEPEEWDEDSYFSQQWGTPDVDQQLVAALETGLKQGTIVRDEQTGQFIPADGLNPFLQQQAAQLIGQVQQGYEARNSKAREFLAGNPYAATWKALQTPLQRMIAEQVQQIVGFRSDAERLQKEYADKLFTTDPATGQRQWSPTGQKFQAAMDELRQETGITDHATLLRLAEKYVLPSLTASAAAPAPALTPLAVPAAAPGAAAPAPAPTPAQVSQQQQETFLQQAAKAAGHQPGSSNYIAAGGGVPGASPNPIDEEEFSNFFSRRAGKGVQVVGRN